MPLTIFCLIISDNDSAIFRTFLAKFISESLLNVRHYSKVSTARATLIEISHENSISRIALMRNLKSIFLGHCYDEGEDREILAKNISSGIINELNDGHKSFFFISPFSLEDSMTLGGDLVRYLKTKIRRSIKE